MLKISVERVKMLYKYRKKGDEQEHYLLGAGTGERAARPRYRSGVMHHGACGYG